MKHHFSTASPTDSRRLRQLARTILLLLTLTPAPLHALPLPPSGNIGSIVEALLLQLKGEHQKAVIIYQRMLEKEPGNAAIHYALAKASVTLSQIDSARVHSEKSVVLDSGNKYYKELLNAIVYQQNRYRRAADHFRQEAALTEGAGKEKPLYTLGQLYFQTGQYDLAIKTFRELVDGNPHLLPGWFALFESDIEARNTAAFDADLRNFQTKALVTWDQHIDFMRVFVIRASRDRAWVAPAQRFIDTAARHPSSRRRYRQAARIFTAELFFLTGETRKAEKILQREIRNPRLKNEKNLYLQARSTLALCYDKQENFPRSIQLYKELLLEEPDNALMMNNLAYTLALQNTELTQALAYALKAVSLEPYNHSYLDTLGWIYYVTGEYEKAREKLEQALQINANEPEIFEHLAAVYDKLGDIRKAREMADRAARLR